jgi:trehalose/maltose hydrolase-like predicted phosphorylase
MALRYLHEIVDFDPDPTVAGGVRIAGVGGIWQAIVLGFGGLDLSGDILGIDPKPPPHVRSLSYHVCWRGSPVAVRVADGTLQATLAAGQPIEVRLAGAAHRLAAGETVQVPVRREPALA